MTAKMKRTGWVAMAVFLLSMNTAFSGWQAAASRLSLFFMRAGDYFEPGLPVEMARAAARGDAAKVSELVKKGADVNEPGRDGMTLLMWAFLKQNKTGFRALLENGADANLITERAGGETVSVIHFAAIMERTDYLQLLVENGGDPNLVHPETGKTPIYEAIGNLRKDNIDLLIRYGANLNFQDRTGQTPLIDASNLNQYDVVYKMVKAGADIWIADNFGETIAYNIEQRPMNPEHELYTWRNKVVDLLREQGMEVLPWTPEKGPGRKLKGKQPSDFGF